MKIGKWFNLDLFTNYIHGDESNIRKTSQHRKWLINLQISIPTSKIKKEGMKNE